MGLEYKTKLPNGLASRRVPVGTSPEDTPANFRATAPDKLTFCRVTQTLYATSYSTKMAFRRCLKPTMLLFLQLLGIAPLETKNIYYQKKQHKHKP